MGKRFNPRLPRALVFGDMEVLMELRERGSWEDIR